jgi:hypothetical protein
VTKKAQAILEKLASSDVVLNAGRGYGYGDADSFSPSTRYHYTEHGKYTHPSLAIDMGAKATKATIGKTVWGESIKGEQGAAYYSPQVAKKFIKQYTAVQGVGAQNAYAKRVDNPNRTFFDKVLKRNKYTIQQDTAGIQAALKNKEYVSDRKKTLDWLTKHQDKGFTITVI